MRFTSLIPGVTCRTDDGEIHAAIQRIFAQAKGSHGVEWVIGVRNHVGVIYREVTVDSFDQIPALSGSLIRLGLREETGEDGRLVDGYDVTYRNV